MLNVKLKSRTRDWIIQEDSWMLHYITLPQRKSIMQAHLSSLCICMKPFYRRALTHLSLSSVFANKFPTEYEQDCSHTLIPPPSQKISFISVFINNATLTLISLSLTSLNNSKLLKRKQYKKCRFRWQLKNWVDLQETAQTEQKEKWVD